MEHLLKLKTNIDYFKVLHGYIDSIEESLDVLLGVQNGIHSVDIIETFYKTTVSQMKVDKAASFRIFFFVNTIKLIFLFLIYHEEEKLTYIERKVEYLSSKFPDQLTV